MDDLSFFEYLSPFCFLSIEFLSTFSISYKILPYFVYFIVFRLGSDKLSPRGRTDDLYFFEYSSPFCFLSIEFHSIFYISYKILQYFVYYYCI